MLERDVKYVFKLSFNYPSSTIYYVGGSPINVKNGELCAYGEDGGAPSGCGAVVAMNNYLVDKMVGAGDILMAPCYLKLKKGEDEAPDFTSKDDGWYPWKSGDTYKAGDLLTPDVESDGSNNYMVWKRVTTEEGGHAKIITTDPAGGAVGTSLTSMIILLGYFETIGV